MCESRLPFVLGVAVFTEQKRWPRIKVYGIRASIAFGVHRFCRVERKRCHIAPIGATKRHHIFEGLIAGLVFKRTAKGQGLPSIWKLHGRSASGLYGHIQWFIDGFITSVVIIAILIGAIELVGRIDGFRTRPAPCGSRGRIEQNTRCTARAGNEGGNEIGEGESPARGLSIPQLDEPIAVGGHRVIEVDFVVLDGEQGVIILRPNCNFAIHRFCSGSFCAELQVIDAFGKMIEVPRMHIWARQIIANGIEHHLIPIA